MDSATGVEDNELTSEDSSRTGRKPIERSEVGMRKIRRGVTRVDRLYVLDCFRLPETLLFFSSIIPSTPLKS